jgi:hypothetical protein
MKIIILNFPYLKRPITLVLHKPTDRVYAYNRAYSSDPDTESQAFL